VTRNFLAQFLLGRLKKPSNAYVCPKAFLADRDQGVSRRFSDVITNLMSFLRVQIFNGDKA